MLTRLDAADAAWLNKDEAEFLGRSEAKRRRNLTWVVGLTAAAFLILSGLTVVALVERRAARTNEGIAKEKTKLAEEERGDRK